MKGKTMKKVAILTIALIVVQSLIMSSCGKLVYKTEGAGADMYLETNMAKYNAAWDSIWDLYKSRITVGSLDNGEYKLYKTTYDTNSSILKVSGYTSQSPYPKFFINEKYSFPEFKSEYIYSIRFLGVDSYEEYCTINKGKRTLVSAINRWNNIEIIDKLYNTIMERNNKADQYPGFEDYPKLGFLEWACSENQSLCLLTDLIQIKGDYYIIIQYGHDDEPKELLLIDSSVAEYFVDNAVEEELPG